LRGKVELTNAIPLQSIEVVLKDATGTIVKKVYTDTSGAYEFTSVESGTYSISYTVPNAYQAESATIGTLGGSLSTNTEISNIPVFLDQLGTEYNFVLSLTTMMIGGIVYTVNPQGQFLAPLSGAMVYLQDASQFSTQSISAINEELLAA
jgi:hypothetical protein